MSEYQFHDYTSHGPHDAPTWAASDRGWLVDTARTRWDGGPWTVGDYCTYGAIPGYREVPEVHAVVYERYENALTGTCGTRTIASKACATVDDARAWMLEALTGQLALI